MNEPVASHTRGAPRADKRERHSSQAVCVIVPAYNAEQYIGEAHMEVHPEESTAAAATHKSHDRRGQFGLTLQAVRRSPSVLSRWFVTEVVRPAHRRYAPRSERCWPESRRRSSSRRTASDSPDAHR